MKKALRIFFLFLLSLIAVWFFFLKKRYPIYAITHSFVIGDSVDSFNGIVVYNNGTVYSNSQGKHYRIVDSFYYGKKWQCVEFIKRYYIDHLHHKMPDGFGHAKDFFNKKIVNGAINKRRDLIQYFNGDDALPEVNDILVFGGKFGHVAIVSEVTNDEVEVIQQNIYMQPRERFPLSILNGKCWVGAGRKPLGWLRIRTPSSKP
ncbi:MAG: CHAP domain-containing protein [Bacteroidota bacterium]|nr:CHAP domain-containing protein [Bacteroidota bacterium]